MTAPAIILSHPQLGDNVGAAARAMKNFGLSELRLIAPKFEWPNDRAYMLASGSGDILDAAKIYPTAAEALAPYNLVLSPPRRGAAMWCAKSIPPKRPPSGCAAPRSTGARTAILFGGERAGLDNDEMSSGGRGDHHSHRGICPPSTWARRCCCWAMNG